ncbi:MAG: hypothetical protein GY749_22000 [Desulfobacteraceae bacterium]|nr:hypothetical protein [Desulfobacteraceae bacterium]
MERKDHNLQFRFSSEAVKRLDQIVKKTFSSTRAETVRNALRIYEYLVEQTEKGYSVQLVKGEDKITLVPLI